MDDFAQGSTRDGYNPYAAPASTVDDFFDDDDDAILASRGSRLSAAMLDGLAWGLIFVPFGAATVLTEVMVPLFIIAGVAALGLIGLNLTWLHRYGQTVGKRALKIRIVRFDGADADLARLIFLRSMLPGMIGAIPFVGGFFSIINILFIFRSDQRCIHDLLADTKVVIAKGIV